MWIRIRRNTTLWYNKWCVKKIKREEIIKYMINKMIRNKMLEKYKIRGKYYYIVVDETGLATSRKNIIKIV